MASIRDLKKDINFVLGDIIDAVYVWEAATHNENSKEGSEIIDKAIAIFDDLLQRVHQKEVTDKKSHFDGIRADLETKTTELVEELNKLEA
ncbi:MAG: hypothetical protein AAGB24_15120 [Bacteroidota bacterium]